MERAKCILCDHDAERNVFTEHPEPTKVAGGYKYICPECELYALDGYEYNFVAYRATDEQKRKLSEYVKSHQDKEGKFKVLRWDEIKRILNLPSPKQQ